MTINGKKVIHSDNMMIEHTAVLSDLLEENEIAKDLEDINYLRINAELTKTLQNFTIFSC